MKTTASLVGWAPLLALLLMAPESSAGNIFLQAGLKPSTQIRGETQDAEFKSLGGIDISAWTWGLTMPVSAAGNAGSRTGRAQFQEMVLTKALDASSTGFMSALAKGKTIDQARLTVRRPGTTAPLHVMEITLFNALVTRVETKSSAQSDRVLETIALSFSNMKIAYFTVDPLKGTNAPAGMFAWDASSSSIHSGGGGSSDKVSLMSVSLPSTSLIPTPVQSSMAYTAGESTALLSWPSVPGTNYRVLAAANLDAPFRVWGDFLAAIGDETTIRVPASSLVQFFRVEVLP